MKKGKYNLFRQSLRSVGELKEKPQNPHDFKLSKLEFSEYCISCKQAISSKKELKCKLCSLFCHQTCEKPSNCTGKQSQDTIFGKRNLIRQNKFNYFFLFKFFFNLFYLFCSIFLIIELLTM
jgi:hypothetical protein